MTYQIQGFQTINTELGCDAERSADTLKAAKLEAKYMLSDAYRRETEASANLVIVQIWKGANFIAEIEG